MKAKKSPEMIKQRKLLRKSTLIIFLGVFVFSGLTMLVVKQSPSIKDRYQAAPKTTEALLRDLAVFQKLPESREYVPFVPPLFSGEKLAFTVSVLRPTFIGLLASVNQQKPSFVFYTRLPPGESRRLGRQGERYIYTVTNLVKKLKFCVIYAESRPALQQMNNRLAAIWSKIPDSSCLSLD